MEASHESQPHLLRIIELLPLKHKNLNTVFNLVKEHRLLWPDPHSCHSGVGLTKNQASWHNLTVTITVNLLLEHNFIITDFVIIEFL